MKKNYLIKLLILTLTVTVGTVVTYAEEVEQALNVSVQPFVSFEKQTSSIETGKVNSANGIHSGLSTIYLIQTDGTDDDYDFTLTSVITSNDGTVSGYSPSGNLLFTNINVPPSLSAIDDAKNGGKNNPNVIAYPTSTKITTPMTSTFTPNYGAFGDCYVIKFNNGTEATFEHDVSGTPVAGTYNLSQDEAGNYQSTVILTVTPKN